MCRQQGRSRFGHDLLFRLKHGMRLQNYLTRRAAVPCDIRNLCHEGMQTTRRIGKFNRTFPVWQGAELLRDVLAFEQGTAVLCKQALRARVGKQDLPAARDENGFAR